jgi:hypothetical protein
MLAQIIWPELVEPDPLLIDPEDWLPELCDPEDWLPDDWLPELCDPLDWDPEETEPWLAPGPGPGSPPPAPPPPGLTSTSLLHAAPSTRPAKEKSTRCRRSSMPRLSSRDAAARNPRGIKTPRLDVV